VPGRLGERARSNLQSISGWGRHWVGQTLGLYCYWPAWWDSIVLLAGVCCLSASSSFVVCNAAGGRAGRPPGARAVGVEGVWTVVVWTPWVLKSELNFHCVCNLHTHTVRISIALSTLVIIVGQLKYWPVFSINCSVADNVASGLYLQSCQVYYKEQSID